MSVSWQRSHAGPALHGGGNNVFNVKPTRQNDLETDNGFLYDSVQFGLNGASYFARAHYKF